MPLTLQESGKLKLVPECIAFKSTKSGQVQQFNTSDIKSLGWMRVAKGYELKVFLQSGKIVKFDGFKEAVRKRATCVASAFEYFLMVYT